MKAIRWMAGAAAAASFAAAVPASAQYYGYDRDRDRVGEVVEGIARVAGAVHVATQGRYYDPRYGNRGRGYGYGYGRGVERHAVDACLWRAQNRYRGARIDVRDVRWHRQNRLRVFGEIDRYGRYDRYSRYDRYDRYGRYDRRRNDRLAFTCTVRPDGRVTGFSTRRIRY